MAEQREHKVNERKAAHRNGVRAAVEWLHVRARSMNDPQAAAILNSAAFNLGVELSARAFLPPSAAPPQQQDLVAETVFEAEPGQPSNPAVEWEAGPMTIELDIPATAEEREQRAVTGGWDRWYGSLPEDLKRRLSIHDFKRLGDYFRAAFSIPKTTRPAHLPTGPTNEGHRR